MLTGSCPGGTKFLSMCEVAHTSAVSMAAIVDSWDAIPHSVAVQRPALEIPPTGVIVASLADKPLVRIRNKKRLLPQPTAPGDLERMIKGAAIPEYICDRRVQDQRLAGV